ncbi:MAG: DUF3999 family protein [Bacteroidota bacterium]
MKALNRILKLSLLLCGFSYTLLAQQTTFKYKSELAGVDSAGYYRINLRPDLTAKAKTDLSDIRVAAPDGGFVAYVKAGDMPANSQYRFVTFPQVKTKDKQDTSTVFVVENPTDGPVKQLWLKLKNTAVERHLTLTGSDDLQQWFAIAENMNLGTAASTDDKGIYEQQLTFPASSYRYLKMVINNAHKSPVNIREAGIYTYLPVKPQYVMLSRLTFTQADSPNHVTHIYINFDEAYPINKLYIPVKLNAYFRREVNVYTQGKSPQWLTSKTFSNEDEYINLSVRAKSLDVQIINNDDRPLPVTHVEAYQSESYIIARLEPKKIYYLIFGNDTATAPKYDLQFFTGKIGNHFPENGHFAIEPNKAYQTKQAQPVNKKPYLLWLSIAVAIAILSALTFSMTREVNKKKV